jgi:beta-galactosidase
VRGINLIYSSADIYTHGTSGKKKILLIYGLAGETHELAFSTKLGKPSVEGGSVKVEKKGSAYVVQWEVSEHRKILHYGDKLDVYLLWRNEAFNYWTLQLESPAPIGNYTSQSKETVIAKAGYLLRTATKSGKTLHLTGDLNATTTLEIIAGAHDVKRVHFNGKQLKLRKTTKGRLTAELTYTVPSLKLPVLAEAGWQFRDTLPEIQNRYDDSEWTRADNTETNNTVRDDAGNVFQLQTPTSLIASDYGFHTGSLIYRGHFAAHGNESSLYLSTTGGLAFGHSVWINETYLGSWVGNSTARSYNQTLDFPSTLHLKAGASYVITVVIDHMGMETNWSPGLDFMKTPRGIIDYDLSGHAQSDITWKLTGNIGGEDYYDQTRGPLNEGGFWAERAGYHLPRPPNKYWARGSPFTGISKPGINFYTAMIRLDIPEGYDVPLSFVFANSTSQYYRAQLYVNGWQFGKYSKLSLLRSCRVFGTNICCSRPSRAADKIPSARRYPQLPRPKLHRYYALGPAGRRCEAGRFGACCGCCDTIRISETEA